MTNFTFTKAAPADAECVLATYRTIVGTPGCLWNEYYPNIESVENSINNGSQYLLSDESGNIAALCAVGHDEEADNPMFEWKLGLENPAYFAALGVVPAHQRQGLGKLMVSLVIGEAVRRGFDGALALVAKANNAAQMTYKDFGFEVTGEAVYYEHEYFLYEMRFRAE